MLVPSRDYLAFGMMKKLLVIFLFVAPLFFVSSVSFGQSVVDRLVGTLIEKKAPNVLYEKTDLPWEYGHYSLRISRAGQSQFSSNQSDLSIGLPVNIDLSGKIKQTIFGAKVTVGCNSNFNTDGNLVVVPKFEKKGTSVQVSLALPIPDVDLICEGIKIPVREPLEKIVADNKLQWQRDLETEINRLLQELAL